MSCKITIISGLSACLALWCVLKALEEGQLELSTAFLVAQETITP